MASAYCPDCDDRINLRTPRVGQKLFCPHCDTQLEVSSLAPLHLDWAYSSPYDEDWADKHKDD